MSLTPQRLSKQVVAALLLKKRYARTARPALDLLTSLLTETMLVLWRRCARLSETQGRASPDITDQAFASVLIDELAAQLSIAVDSGPVPRLDQEGAMVGDQEYGNPLTRREIDDYLMACVDSGTLPLPEHAVVTSLLPRPTTRKLINLQESEQEE